jgi:hypothetical protein
LRSGVSCGSRFLRSRRIPRHQRPETPAWLRLGLQDNLRTFFTQDYPSYEILFATRDPADPALGIVAKLAAEFPSIPVRTIVTGKPPYCGR